MPMGMKNGEAVTANVTGCGQKANENAADTFSSLLSEHESALSSHRDSLQSLLTATVTGESNDTAVSLEASLKSAAALLANFKELRLQWLKIHTNSELETPASSSKSAMPPSHNDTPHRTDSLSGSASLRPPQKSTRKRSRSNDENDGDVNALNASQISRDHPSKRKRTSEMYQSAEEDIADIVPVSMRSDDISEEVERRLKLKEERRKMKIDQQQRRKRLRVDQEYTPPSEGDFQAAKRVKHPTSEKEYG